MMINRLSAVSVMCVILLGGCGSLFPTAVPTESSTAVPTVDVTPDVLERDPDIRGEIKNYFERDDGFIALRLAGIVLWHGEPDRTEEIDVYVDENTQIYIKDNGFALGKASDLEEAQWVEVIVRGGIMESYPLQAYADEIIILSLV